MTLQEYRHAAHHDLTWLTGALARALFARADACAEVIPVLEKVAACDFHAPLAAVSPTLAPACRHLPETVIAAAMVVEEVAMALAASLEHLRWEAGDDETATAWVLGPHGPIRAENAGIFIAVGAPGTAIPLSAPALAFLLAGEAAFPDAAGALRHANAGAVAACAGDALRAGEKPLLAALLPMS